MTKRKDAADGPGHCAPQDCASEDCTLHARCAPRGDATQDCAPQERGPGAVAPPVGRGTPNPFVPPHVAGSLSSAGSAGASESKSPAEGKKCQSLQSPSEGKSTQSPPEERRVGQGGKHPETNMEIAVIARRRVRGMIQVLNEIAREKKNPCSARVSAAKAIIEFARLKQEDVQNLTDHQVRELARQIIEGRSSSVEEGRALSKAAGLPPTSRKQPRKGGSSSVAASKLKH